jgi:hypothetical protein
LRRQGLAGLANAGVSQWLEAGFLVGAKRTTGWLRASCRPTKVKEFGACPVRRDVHRRTIEASAYDIVNENDLQYLIAAKASAMPTKKAPHSHAGPPVFLPR